MKIFVTFCAVEGRGGTDIEKIINSEFCQYDHAKIHSVYDFVPFRKAKKKNCENFSGLTWFITTHKEMPKSLKRNSF